VVTAPAVFGRALANDPALMGYSSEGATCETEALKMCWLALF
jgi:hypothetical protein